MLVSNVASKAISQSIVAKSKEKRGSVNAASVVARAITKTIVMRQHTLTATISSSIATGVVDLDMWLKNVMHTPTQTASCYSFDKRENNAHRIRGQYTSCTN